MGFRNFSNFVLSLTLICLLFSILPVAYDIFVKCTVFVALVLAADGLMKTTRRHFLYQRVSCDKKAVLITGCDTGFGNELARRMDGLGYRVFAACLQSDGEGATSLAKNCSPRLCLVPLDVTSEQSVRTAREFVSENLGTDELWAVVNNAGIAQAGEVDWTPMEDMVKVYDVNTLGTLRVAKEFLRLLKQSRGRLINNTSACGTFTCPGYVGYCMSKSAGVVLTTGLRIEMMKWGVKVISIEPFFYKTPLTKDSAAVDLAEKTWCKADPQARLDYGEEYKENFAESTRRTVQLSSPHVHEVIDCFEDAITAHDPLSTYEPCWFPHKVGIQLLKTFPKVLMENYMRYELERGMKPAALTKNDK